MSHAAPLHLTLATRESRLAMWQAEHVRDALQALGHQVRLLGMTTRGDQILDRSLSKVGGKGLFVKELEVAMQEGQADLAVHSLKDVPMDLPAGFELACVMTREDPHDAWVSAVAATPLELPEGAVLGTSSLRRTVLLRDLLQRGGRADVRIEPLRGNLDTRLRKLDEAQYQGIVLAASGLKRLGLGARIRHVFSADEMLPAAGQGALGIEIPQGREPLRQALQALCDEGSWLRVAAERAVSRSLGGSCSMPLAAYATWTGAAGAIGQPAVLKLDAAWGDAEPPSGVASDLLRVGESALVASLAEAEALGMRVAAALRAAGAH